MKHWLINQVILKYVSQADPWTFCWLPSFYCNRIWKIQRKMKKILKKLFCSAVWHKTIGWINKIRQIPKKIGTSYIKIYRDLLIKSTFQNHLKSHKLQTITITKYLHLDEKRIRISFDSQKMCLVLENAVFDVSNESLQFQ